MSDSRSTTSQPGEFFAAVRNDRGVALILVMIMILLLSILGATVLTSTTTDLRITGNYRNLESAFYTAESALEFAQSNSNVYTSILPNTQTHWPIPNEGKVLDAAGESTGAGNSAYPNYHRLTVGGNEAHVKVDYLSSGSVPSGLGTEVDAGLGSGTGFQANFYVVSAIGTGPNNSRAEIESHIVRVVPK